MATITGGIIIMPRLVSTRATRRSMTSPAESRSIFTSSRLYTRVGSIDTSSNPAARSNRSYSLS